MDVTKLLKMDENKLSKSEIKVHHYIIKNFNSLENTSISNMANDLYIDHSVITRYCQKIGFSGYKDLKYKIEKPLPLKTKSPTNDFDILHNQLDENSLKKISDDFKEARTIIFYGEGPNYHILQSIVYRLEIHIRTKKFITFNDYKSVINWINTKEKTLLFLTTTKAKNENLDMILKLAKINNASIVLITGNKQAELQKYSDYVFYTKNNEVINRKYPGDLLPRYQTLFFVEKIIEHILENNTL